MAQQQEFDVLPPKNEGTAATNVLGTMNFGARTPEAEAIKIMDMALERGVDWFDTANYYGDGEAERIIGRYLKEKKGNLLISTKGGIGAVSGPKEGLSANALRKAIDDSLSRLQIEHINLYYLNAPDRGTPIAETITVMEEARKAGKIGGWGVSNFSSWRIAELHQACDALGAAKPHVSQVVYNLLIRQLELEYFDFAKSRGLHTVVYSPLASGLLAGKGIDSIEKDGRFSNLTYQERYLTPKLRDLAQAYAALAKDSGLDRTAMAYAWLSQHPGVDSIVLGPATAYQFEDAVNSWGATVDKAVAAKIDQIYRSFAGTDVSYAL